MMMDNIAGEPILARPPEASWNTVRSEDRRAAGELEIESAVVVPPATAALWAVLATVIMLFAGFSSAYLVRRASPDWIPIYAPSILWINTGLLLFSSLTLEIAKTTRKFGMQAAFRGWFIAAVGFGALFLAGQWMAWSDLATKGIFLPTSPHGSFFYMLSAVHAFHVIAGMLALGVVLMRHWRESGHAGAGDPVNLCATYWHFVTGIWIYLYWLFFVWR